jgi:hypothetical protein
MQDGIRSVGITASTCNRVEEREGDAEVRLYYQMAHSVDLHG